MNADDEHDVVKLCLNGIDDIDEKLSALDQILLTAVDQVQLDPTVELADTFDSLATGLKTGGFLETVASQQKSTASACNKLVKKAVAAAASSSSDLSPDNVLPILGISQPLAAVSEATPDLDSALVDHLLTEHPPYLQEANALNETTQLYWPPEQRARDRRLLKEVSDAILLDQLEPLLQWVETNRSAAAAVSPADDGQINDAISASTVQHEHRRQQSKISNLMLGLSFRCHRARFLGLLSGSNDGQALIYARSHFPAFQTLGFEAQVQQLMSLFVGSEPLEDRAQTLSELRDLFQSVFAALHGLPQQSHLRTAFNAGTTAMPAYMKATALANKGLPVDLTTYEVPSTDLFHSVFVCPVSKQVNGAVCMLPCGHAIARESAEQLAGTAYHRRRLKCPYCPTEFQLQDLKDIFF